MRKKSRSTWVSAAVAAVSFVFLAPASAYDFDQAKVKIAKEKGTITWYTSVFPEELRLGLAEDFRKQTGLDLVIGFAGGTGQVTTRIATEQKVGSYQVDVVDLVDEEVINTQIDAGILRAYDSVGRSNISASSCKDDKGFWTGFYFWVLMMEYNTNLLDKSELPTSWSELNEDKWANKVVVADPYKSSSGLGFVKGLVKMHGWDWIEKLAKNNVLVQTSGPGVHQSVLKGERLVGAPVSSFHSKTRSQGGPVAMAIDEVLFAATSTISVTADAPNPEGGELLVDYLLSKEAGDKYLSYGWFACHDDVPGPFGLPAAGDLKMKFPGPPSIGMPGPDVAAKFHEILQAN